MVEMISFQVEIHFGRILPLLEGKSVQANLLKRLKLSDIVEAFLTHKVVETNPAKAQKYTKYICTLILS